jgi:hypothetical protein
MTIGAAFVLGACSPSTTPDVSPVDAVADVAPPPPRTLTFVFDRLEIDPTDDPSQPHSGFNLDDLFSTDIDPGGCGLTDFFAMYDDDQHCADVVDERCATAPNPGCRSSDPACRGGVDNQLPTLANTILTAANTDVRANLAESVAHNEVVLLVRVSGIDNLANDDAVRVAFYRGFPRFIDGCDRVDPGREYSIDRRDLSGGADVDVNARVGFDASIVDGRLRVRGTPASPVLDVPFIFLEEVIFSLPLHAARFRADIGIGALDRGTLGGFTPPEELVQPSKCWQCPDPFQVIGGLVDIQMDGICDGSNLNPRGFGAIGMGLGVHAVSATISISQPIADARIPGSCGSPIGDAGDEG